MRRVLVDDDDAVRGLRDDIGLVQLRAGGAQRISSRPALVLRRRAPRARAAAALEGCKRRLGEAAAPIGGAPAPR